jgi:hypothetical protein
MTEDEKQQFEDAARERVLALLGKTLDADARQWNVPPGMIQAANAGVLMALVDAAVLIIARATDDPDAVAKKVADRIITDVALLSAKGFA